MIEHMYTGDDIQHVRVDTFDDLNAVIKQHGGAWRSFEGLPYGIDTEKDIIGEQPCNDGIHICFHAPDATAASKIWEEMF